MVGGGGKNSPFLPVPPKSPLLSKSLFPFSKPETESAWGGWRLQAAPGYRDQPSSSLTKLLPPQAPVTPTSCTPVPATVRACWTVTDSCLWLPGSLYLSSHLESRLLPFALQEHILQGLFSTGLWTRITQVPRFIF